MKKLIKKLNKRLMEFEVSDLGDLPEGFPLRVTEFGMYRFNWQDSEITLLVSNSNSGHLIVIDVEIDTEDRLMLDFIAKSAVKYLIKRLGIVISHRDITQAGYDRLKEKLKTVNKCLTRYSVDISRLLAEFSGSSINALHGEMYIPHDLVKCKLHYRSDLAHIHLQELIIFSDLLKRPKEILALSVILEQMAEFILETYVGGRDATARD